VDYFNLEGKEGDRYGQPTTEPTWCRKAHEKFFSLNPTRLSGGRRTAIGNALRRFPIARGGSQTFKQNDRRCARTVGRVGLASVYD
jgi:hypothetical protein